jgi:hypothetical protein
MQAIAAAVPKGPLDLSQSQSAASVVGLAAWILTERAVIDGQLLICSYFSNRIKVIVLVAPYVWCFRLIEEPGWREAIEGDWTAATLPLNDREIFVPDVAEARRRGDRAAGLAIEHGNHSGLWLSASVAAHARRIALRGQVEKRPQAVGLDRGESAHLLKGRQSDHATLAPPDAVLSDSEHQTAPSTAHSITSDCQGSREMRVDNVG